MCVLCNQKTDSYPYYVRFQEAEKKMKKLEAELEQERRMTESMVADMEPEMQEKFKKLKVKNLQLQEVT